MRTTVILAIFCIVLGLCAVTEAFDDGMMGMFWYYYYMWWLQQQQMMMNPFGGQTAGTGGTGTGFTGRR